MHLRHVHISGLTQYAYAAQVQDRIVAAQLAHKAHSITVSAPDPVIITAEFYPVYTCGRREVGGVSQQQKDLLTAPTAMGRADFREALRGGQTTFHGPGQLVAYPILDLKRHKLTPRSYVCLLEKSIIRVCQDDFGIAAATTKDPGVWTDDTHKICALGIHLRRNITSHGIGFNVSTDLRWFNRIVACGLEGKTATSLVREGAELASVEDVGRLFVQRLSERLEGIQDVIITSHADLN